MEVIRQYHNESLRARVPEWAQAIIQVSVGLNVYPDEVIGSIIEYCAECAYYERVRMVHGVMRR